MKSKLLLVKFDCREVKIGFRVVEVTEVEMKELGSRELDDTVTYMFVTDKDGEVERNICAIKSTNIEDVRGDIQQLFVEVRADKLEDGELPSWAADALSEGRLLIDFV